MNINIKNIRITDWLWVTYPILVAVFMIISLNFLMGSGPKSVLSIIFNQSQNSQEQKTMAQLKAKLEALKSINRESEYGKLTSLLVAMPPAKRVWYLLEAVDISASNAGMAVTDYGGSVGDVKEASASATVSAQINNPDNANIMSLIVNYKPTAFENMADTIKELESYLPLIKITKVAYSKEKVTLSLEGAWGQFITPAKEAGEQLPVDYQEKVNKALNDIQGMQDLTAGGN